MLRRLRFGRHQRVLTARLPHLAGHREADQGVHDVLLVVTAGESPDDGGLGAGHAICAALMTWARRSERRRASARRRLPLAATDYDTLLMAKSKSKNVTNNIPAGLRRRSLQGAPGAADVGGAAGDGGRVGGRFSRAGPTGPELLSFHERPPPPAASRARARLGRWSRRAYDKATKS